MAAYTYRATGTIAQNNDSSALSPGAPAGKTVGDLLLLYATNRTVNAQCPTPTGYALLAHNGVFECGCAIFGRIADGTGTDTPTVDWDGSNDSQAWIEAWHGDVYTGDIRTIVVSGPIYEGSATTTVPFAPALGVSKDDCLIILLTVKGKTAASNDATDLTPPAGFTRRSQNIQTGTALASASASLQQTTATDHDGTDWTINGTSENLVGAGCAIAIRTAGTVSTIIPDAATAHVRTDTTSPQSVSHAGASSGVKGVAAFIIYGSASPADHLGSNVPTYGGVPMGNRQRNADTATEPGSAEMWFLGSGIPQGTQNFSYTPGGTDDDILAVVMTFLAGGDLEVIDSDGTGENQANPSVSMQSSGREAMSFAALYNGLPSITDFTENEHCTRIANQDLGNFVAYAFRQIYSRNADVDIGGTVASDDVALAVITVSPVSVSSSPVLGRRFYVMP